MAKDRYQLHPAADIFRDHLLCKVEDENERLRECNKRLESAREIFTNIELHLRDGHVMSTAFTRSFVMNGQDERGYDVCITIDADESDTRPLSDFSEGDIRLMGQSVGTLSGLVTLLGIIHITGTVYLRFSLSGHCAVMGALRNLSVEDFARFVDKSFSNRKIMTFLRTGIGLQNAASITFTPLMFLLEISPMLQRTLEFIDSRPSIESAKNDLVCHVTEIGSRRPQAERKSEPTVSSGLEELLSAVGHTDEMLELLAQNRLLKFDRCGFRKIQEMIGMVEIAHPGFNFKISLRDGKLHDYAELVPVWRVLLIEKATVTSIRGLGLTSMKVFLAGMPLPLSVSGIIEVDGDWFWATLHNGTKIFCCISCPGFSWHHGSGCHAIITIDFPLPCVRRILGVLGVDV